MRYGLAVELPTTSKDKLNLLSAAESYTVSVRQFGILAPASLDLLVREPLPLYTVSTANPDFHHQVIPIQGAIE